ncbi:hypothetical protein WA171_006317 [Blastocystis sp. BT1]
MGRTGKSEWDAAMSASGHRVVEKKKKWTSRLRSTTKNTNIVDNITREQILNERLEALERDNYDEEETVNESELYDEKEDDLKIRNKRRKDLVKAQSSNVLPVLRFAKVVFQDKLMKEATGSPCYVSAASRASQFPPRRFCGICGYPVIIGN